jgi:hypothetical protein
MGKQRSLVCSWFLTVVFFFAGSAWAQVVPSEYYALRTTGRATNATTGELPSLQGFSRPPLELARASATGIEEGIVSAPSPSVDEPPAHDRAAVPSLAPCGSKQGVIRVEAEPASANTPPPATLTVRTSAMLELHEMRQSAVDLCLQLPVKYRTQLPQCADIFKHEIRLKALAKERP